MGKHSKREYRQVRERRWKVHPIWRGIGCFFIALIPVMSYAGAVLISQRIHSWVRVPPELNGFYDLGAINSFLNSFVPQVSRFIPYLGRIYYLQALLIFAFLVIGFGGMTVFYSILYQAMGAKIYSPVDAPPIRRSPNRRTH